MTKPLFAEDTPTEAHNRRLRIRFQVDDSDLEMNRQGLLSAAQRDALRSENRFSVVALAILSLIAGYVIVRIPSTAFTVKGADAPLMLAITIGFVILVLAILISRTFSDLRSNRVIIYEGVIGRVTKKTLGRSETLSYQFKVGKTVVNVPPAAYDVFKVGAAYRLFCTPARRVVIAAELLEELPAR